MKCVINYEILKPNTVNGYGVKVITTYTSFDKEEIDDVCDYLKDGWKGGVITEVSE